MKKLLSILMAVAILATTLAIPAFAADTETRDINDYLTIHYDFEGSNNDDRLADKAPQGSADNLSIDAGDETRFNFTNGTVQNTSVSNPTLIAAASNDLKQANEGSGTWFLRFRVNETPTNPLELLYLRDTSKSRAFYLTLTANGQLQGSTSKGTDPSGYVNPFIGTMSHDTIVGNWVNLFAVRQIDTAGKYEIRFYYALGEPTAFADYTYMGRFVVGTEEEGLASSEGLPLYLFNASGASNNLTGKFELDDLRYYNTNLSNDEIGSFVRNGSFCWTENRNINDYMTIHYDFEETGNGVLADKATVGTPDDLTFALGDSNSNGFKFEDGAVTSISDEKNLLLTREITNDTIETNTGEGTWFFRVKAAELTSTAPIMDFRLNSKSRAVYLALKTDGNLEFAACTADSPKGYTNKTYTCGYSFETSPWLNLAAIRSVSCVSSVNYYYYTLYYSIGTSDCWEKIGAFQVGTVAAGLAPTDEIHLAFFQQPTQSWNLVPGLSIDDVRYYDTELTLSEIASILPSAEIADEHTEFVGYQVSEIYEKDGSNYYKLRLIGEIDSREYTEAGLRLTVTVDGVSQTTDNPVTTVFTSLLTNYGKDIREAAEGKYLFAVVITDIPADILPTVAVTTYAKNDSACYFGGNPVTCTVTANDFTAA